MGVSRRRVGREPGPSPRNATSVEVETAVTGEGRVSKSARHRLGLNLARQRLLRRRITLSTDVGTRRDNASKGVLGCSKVAPIIEVEGQRRLHKSRQAEKLATHAAGASSAAHLAPNPPREGSPTQVTECRANIMVWSQVRDSKA